MKKYIKNKFYLILIISLVFFNPTIAYSGITKINNIQTLDNQIEVKVLAYKKTRYYTAIEIGFTNPIGDYLEFTPKEIYLDDAVKYSLPLLTPEQIRNIEAQKPNHALIPAVLGVGLGIAAIATSRSSSNASFGLTVAALSMGGAALLTGAFDNQQKHKKFISFENNSLNNINKIPPGMTLGGVLYFPPAKKPVSVTIMAKSRSGGYEKKVFLLEKTKKNLK